MARPKLKRMGDPNRQPSRSHNQAAAETVRAANLDRKTPEGQAGREVSYDPQAVRAAIEAQQCPFCGRGPYKVLAVHTCKAHEVDRRELRELAGLNGSASICAPEFAARARELAYARDLPALGAAVDRDRRPSSYRVTSAGRAAVTANLQKYMDGLTPEEANGQRRKAARTAAEQRTKKAMARRQRSLLEEGNSHADE